MNWMVLIILLQGSHPHFCPQPTSKPFPLQPTCSVSNLLPALADWLSVLQQDLKYRARQNMTPKESTALRLGHLCVTVGGSLLNVRF